MRKQKGITLIALVVTIVVLLILAGVSIAMLRGDNGIITQAQKAKKQTEIANENESTKIDETADWIDEKVNGIRKISVGEKATTNGTINGENGNANNPTIPKGYTPINEGEAIWGDGNKAPEQNSVDHGLVIKDDNNNEWVWIPVPDVTMMCDISNKIEYTLTETSGENVGKTKLYSKSEIISGQTRGKPGESTYREPDTLESYDPVDTMAKPMVRDYERMIKSIQKYGGFYIGRYELSEEGEQKDKVSLVKAEDGWYGLYEKCKQLNASNKVETRMIWGCQWDMVCNFIANKGDKKDISNTNDWGNCNNAVSPANQGNYEKDADGNNIIKNTGSNEAWKANNIYDVAGNCSEWTQEAVYKSSRAIRDAKTKGSHPFSPNYDGIDGLRLKGNNVSYSIKILII